MIIHALWVSRVVETTMNIIILMDKSIDNILFVFSVPKYLSLMVCKHVIFSMLLMIIYLHDGISSRELKENRTACKTVKNDTERDIFQCSSLPYSSTLRASYPNLFSAHNSTPLIATYLLQNVLYIWRSMQKQLLEKTSFEELPFSSRTHSVFFIYIYICKRKIVESNHGTA